jgi:CRP-like cAMP-binding protein
MSPQTQKQRDSDPKENLLLASLDREDYEILMRDAKVVPLKFRKRLYRQDDLVNFVYFPMTCMVSLLVGTNDKLSIEMATIGREGVVGASELIQGQGAMGLSVVQLPGTAAQINRFVFQKVARSRLRVQDVIHRHLFALLRQVLLGAACNRLHNMEQRCARWLLMTHDRAGQDSFPLTQQFLSQMLGVRRATVNAATGILKKKGFIQFVRGRVTIIDRQGLESAACGCYQATIQAYNSILGSPDKSM